MKKVIHPQDNTLVKSLILNATKRMILDYYNSESYRNYLSQSGIFGSNILVSHRDPSFNT